MTAFVYTEFLCKTLLHVHVSHTSQNNNRQLYTYLS